jgi:signal transduction histidine kinase
MNPKNSLQPFPMQSGKGWSIFVYFIALFNQRIVFNILRSLGTALVAIASGNGAFRAFLDFKIVNFPFMFQRYFADAVLVKQIGNIDFFIIEIQPYRSVLVCLYTVADTI